MNEININNNLFVSTHANENVLEYFYMTFFVFDQLQTWKFFLPFWKLCMSKLPLQGKIQPVDKIFISPGLFFFINKHVILNNVFL